MSKAVKNVIVSAVSAVIFTALAAIVVLSSNVTMDQIGLILCAVIAFVISAFAVTVLLSIWGGTIDLTYLISEPPSLAAKNAEKGSAKASLSRFQALVFTFVIAGLYLVISLKTGNFATLTDNGPLILLGITTAGYLGGKAISEQQTTATTDSTSAATTSAAADKANAAADKANAAADENKQAIEEIMKKIE